MATLVYLGFECGPFCCPTTAVLSHPQEDCLAHRVKNSDYLIIFRKILLISSLNAYLGLSALSFCNSQNLSFPFLNQVNQQMMGLTHLDHVSEL